MQIGHRNSVDIDLFGHLTAAEFEITYALQNLGKLNHISKSKNINIYAIDNIKIDIVNYPYPWLETNIEEQKLRMAGLKDIAAMKLAAITGRGTKKDFIDVYFLLKKYSLIEMINFYKEKYSDGSEIIVLKSLSYFTDAENDENPKMFRKVSWEKIKETIRKELKTII